MEKAKQEVYISGVSKNGTSGSAGREYRAAVGDKTARREAILAPKPDEGVVYTAAVRRTSASLEMASGVLFFTDGNGKNGFLAAVRGNEVLLLILENGEEREIARRAVEPVPEGSTVWVRVKIFKQKVEVYYFDGRRKVAFFHEQGVSPWPVFAFALSPAGSCLCPYGEDVTVTEAGICLADQTDGPLFQNPVLDSVQAADPGVLFYKGVYYLYCTSAPVGYYVFTSTDLVHWKNEGYCLESAWEKSRWYWAPEVVERNGRFYMIMSVEEYLGIASSDSPLGPFVPEASWIFPQSIDGHFFLDEDGKAYLYYVTWRPGKRYGIYAMEMNEDMATPKFETETLVLEPETPWETSEGRVTEGPFVLKHKGRYYLTYSAPGYTSYRYGIGYAVSNAPMGPYVKYPANPVLGYTSAFHGPGHHSFTVNQKGEWIVVYHVHQAPGTVHPRKVCVDRARFVEASDGIDRLEVCGPTHLPQAYLV